MKPIALGLLVAISLAGSVLAGDTISPNTFPILATKRGIFTNAAIRSVSGGYAVVVYDGGGVRVPLADLPEEVRKRYPTNAAGSTAGSADNRLMSPAEYLQKQNDPAVVLRLVNSQINTLRGQIAALQRAAAEARTLASSPQLPTQASTLTPVTAEMFLSPTAPHSSRPPLEVYNDQLQGLLKFRDQLEQMVLARQRSQYDAGN